MTDPNGGFEVHASGEPGLWNFLVSAPGFAVHVGTRPVSGEHPVELTLDPHPGTLVLPGDAGDLLLSHGGTFLPVRAFLRFAFPGRGQDLGDPIVIEGVEPGPYHLCETAAPLTSPGSSGESCAQGVLAPYGELRLEVPGRAVAR